MAGPAPSRLSILAYLKSAELLCGLSAFFEQIGRNTSYIIDPEEIVADNFAVLAAGGSEVRSPEILACIENIIAAFGARAEPVR